MVVNPSAQVLSALQLMSRGRFSDAVLLLENVDRRMVRRQDLFADAVLADALQRVGFNDRAYDLARRNLPKAKQESSLAARYHFILGNISRERGRDKESTEHFQMAVLMSAADPELACWSQLRLMLVIAELSGTPAALARLDEVKRSLTKFGDARAFAALHIWLVEVESTRGNLAGAKRHLKVAESLLSNVEDVWLRGYMAINSSALNYYCADIVESRRFAEEAIDHARESGHRTTLLAANANLGNIELSLGELERAQMHFEVALSYCEKGSVNEVALLDNLAQVQLQLGHWDECRSMIATLENLIDHSRHAKRRHYTSCALLTKTRLLLHEGRQAEALRVTEEVKQLLAGSSPTRIFSEAHLLCAETLLANGRPDAAAQSLLPVSTFGSRLPPDLLARREQLTGRVLLLSGAFEHSRVHLQRAVQIFVAIGHSSGLRRSTEELATVPEPNCDGHGNTSQRSLDRIRSLLDSRDRPELLGHEAVSFLEELACTRAITLTVESDGQPQHSLRSYGEAKLTTDSDACISIVLSTDSQRTVTLSFVPETSTCGRLTAATFEDVVKRIVSTVPMDSIHNDNEIVWHSDGGRLVNDSAVFASDSMLAVLRMVKQIAPTDVSVLVTGETGTGKEVIARTIHEQSSRAGMPFMAVNCAAVPKDLLESQLFGYRKGAFSGASENYHGLVRAANGGTLFLDEVGEIPLEMQAKLLRFLEMSEVHPIGESYPVKVNVRLIFATNSDLEDAVTQNRFRRDLFYRLNVIPVKIPPLRERKEEIPILTHVFAKRFALELAKEPIRLSTSSMERLILHSWPGNVRELSNEIRRLAVIKESGALVTPDELSPSMQAWKGNNTHLALSRPHVSVSMDQTLDRAMEQLEREMIKHAMQNAKGQVSSAAAMLGVSRKGLYLKRLRLGID